MYKKHILLLIFIITGCSILTARQKYNTHEISASVAPGFSTLLYNSGAGDNKKGIGGFVGFEYDFPLTEYLYLETGLQLSNYNTTFRLNEFRYTLDMVDEYGDDCVFDSHLTDYRERQRTYYLNIPLMVQYRFPNTDGFFISVGGKLGIPVLADYKINRNTFTNTLYYPGLNVTVDSPRSKKLGTFKNEFLQKGEFDINMAYFASAEIGKRWKWQKNIISTSLFIDYGINNVLNSNPDREFINYQTNGVRSSFVNNGSILSTYTNKDGNNEAFMNTMTPFAFGIRVKLILYQIKGNKCMCDSY